MIIYYYSPLSHIMIQNVGHIGMANYFAKVHIAWKLSQTLLARSPPHYILSIYIQMRFLCFFSENRSLLQYFRLSWWVVRSYYWLSSILICSQIQWLLAVAKFTIVVCEKKSAANGHNSVYCQIALVISCCHRDFLCHAIPDYIPHSNFRWILVPCTIPVHFKVFFQSWASSCCFGMVALLSPSCNHMFIEFSYRPPPCFCWNRLILLEDFFLVF